MQKLDVWRYPHKAVVLTAYETIINYSRYLPNDAAVISALLNAFFGNWYFYQAQRAIICADNQFIYDHSGMRSVDLTVRSRAAYMFFRLCRAQKNLLIPYLTQILTASQVSYKQSLSMCCSLTITEQSGSTHRKAQ